MVLDVVLAAPELTWLGTESEKVAYSTERRSVAVDDVPALVFSQGRTRTVRAFPEKLPIGVGAGQGVVFAYVVADPTGRDFRRFLGRHRRLFQRLPRWTVRVAFPVATQEQPSFATRSADSRRS